MRHAYTDLNMGIGAGGKHDLRLLLQKLDRLAFKAIGAITSPTLRTVETGRIVSGLEPITEEYLGGSGDKKEIGLLVRPGDTFPEIVAAELFIPRALDLVLSHAHDAGDYVFVGHDYVPLLLAQEMVRRNGGELPWNSESLRDRAFPDQGEGVLVSGTEYTILRTDEG